MRAGSQRNHALMGRLSKPIIRPVGQLLPDGEAEDLIDGESCAVESLFRKKLRSGRSCLRRVEVAIA
jgi:hypothetical protein